MPFTLPPLPYDREALAPHISGETLDYHYGKHHQAYVTKTNELVETKGLQAMSLNEVIKHSHQSNDAPLYNNSAQVWNHSFYWQGLSPQKTQPTGKLAEMIARDFGTVEDLTTKLAAAGVGHFGSGWAWLVLDGDTLKITSLHDADTPVAHDVVPLLTLDVWEHAYYVDYHNARPRYAEAVLSNLINWDFVAQNLDGQGAARADQPAMAMGA